MITRAIPILSLLCLLHAEAALAQDGEESEGMVEARLVLDVASVGETGGAERLGSMQTGRLSNGQTRSSAVRLAVGKCFVVVGKGGPGIDNLDVALASGRSVLVRDPDTSAVAVARWCNSGERPIRAQLRVTAYRGSGQYAAAVYALDPAVAAAQEAELAGETALTRLTSLVERHGGGMRQVTVAVRESLSEGEFLERNVPLRPGRCYRVLAAGERGVTDLDLSLVGPGGATLGRDASNDGTPTLGVVAPLCPASPGDYRLTLRLESGEGAFAWQVLGSVPRDGQREGGRAEVTRYRVGGASNSYVAGQIRGGHSRHGEGRRPITDLITGRLAAGERAEHRFRVTGGQCYVVLAAAVPSARDLDLEIRDPHGNRRGEDDGAGAAPHVRVCPRVAGSYVARVYMFQGYGNYGVQIFVGAP